MKRRDFIRNSILFTASATGGGVLSALLSRCSGGGNRPNIILIYADDLGYGDLGCYGAERVQTPHVDQLAREGIRFTQAYSTAATCTPSRYSLLTGEYAWRREGTGIARGDAALIIEPGRLTLPALLGRAGYTSGVVGKWHLGLGEDRPDWNGEIKPGPLEIGFDYSFIIPATGDRIPCVYVENHRVVRLDSTDPIQVSFDEKVGDDPTGRMHPEMLKVQADDQHSDTIINGISRIGYMEGGTSARWVDEEMAGVISGKAVQFIERNRHHPFFLYFSLHDIHVPRVPNSRFVGQTDMGPRGDVIVQLDWCVGEILDTLDRLNLTQNTMVIFSSDNGPVLNDGYEDQAEERVGDHRVTGPLRGGKYSSFEGGTRIPFIVRWPQKIQPGESEALISQVDFLSSFARLTGQSLSSTDAPDSVDLMSALTGESKDGRQHLVQEAMGNHLSLRMGDWKYIVPGAGAKIMAGKNIETGRDPNPQLYNLAEDVGEKNNVAANHPEVLKQMQKLMDLILKQGDRFNDISNSNIG
ncbi:arylsulfatase [bacterium]|nr:arylsulfatase [bacterium]